MPENLKIRGEFEGPRSPLEVETKSSSLLEADPKLAREVFDASSQDRAQSFLLEKATEFAYAHNAAGVFTFISPTVERITGYTHEEWSQHDSRNFTDHPDNDWVVQATERTLRTGEKSDPYLVEIYHKNGSRLILEVDEEAVLEDEQVIGIVGVARDVTDRVLATRIRMEAQRSLQLILDSLPLGIFWKDRDSRYLGCNRPFAKDAGKRGPGEIIGRTDYDMIWAEQAEGCRSDDFEIMHKGESKLDSKSHYRASDGREARLRMNKMPLRDSSGGVIGVLGTYESASSERTTQKRNHDPLIDQLEEKTRRLVKLRDEISRHQHNFNDRQRAISSARSQNIQIGDLGLEPGMSLAGAIQVVGEKLRAELPSLKRDELETAHNSALTLVVILGDMMRISDTRTPQQGVIPAIQERAGEADLRHRILIVGGGSESRSKLRATLELSHCTVSDTGSYGRGVELTRVGLFDLVLLNCDADSDKALHGARRIREQTNGGVASIMLGISEEPLPSLRKRCHDSGMVDLLDHELECVDLEKLRSAVLD